jgi:hypothetical protein
MRRNLAITTVIALALALVVTNFTLAAGSDTPRPPTAITGKRSNSPQRASPTRTSTSTRPG